MRRKLLLADDSITVQRVIELTFADEDLDVSTVGDGGEAIARIERDRPDIVLADLTMPVCDGYAVAEHVKRTPALAAQTRVILLTGAFEPVDQERAGELGVDGVLAKPFEPRVAIELVRALLTQPPLEAKQAAGRSFVPLPGSDREEDERRDQDERQESRATAAAGYPFEPDSGSPRSTPAELDDYFKRLDEALASAGLVASSAVRDMLAESKVKTAASDAAAPAQASSGTAAAPAPAAASAHDRTGLDRPVESSRQEKNAMSGLSPSAQPSPAPGASAGPPPAGQASGTLVDAFSALLAAEQGDPAEEGSVPESRAFRPDSVAPPTLSVVPAMTTPAASAAAPSLPPVSSPAIAAVPADPGAAPIAVSASAAASFSAASAAVSADAVALNDALIEAVAKRVVDQLGDRIVREVVNATVVDIAERLVREEIERLKAAAGHA
jgi:CheY-like chemotaxis protein